MACWLPCLPVTHACRKHTKVAAELGMSRQTLCYWRALARQRGKVAPVAIVAKREPTREVLVECGPLRVHGLDVAGVAELLRRLG
jgi:transposase-like protein